MDNILSIIEEYLYVLPGVIIALSFHEFSHAFVSYKLGDPTPKIERRLTLSPFRHIDPIGFLMLLVFRFGWAKPVPVNMSYYKNKKLGMVLVSLAGPVSNFLLAFVTLVVYSVPWYAKIYGGLEGTPFIIVDILSKLLFNMVFVNIGLGVFNLIPISPLDGSKIFAAFLPLRAYYKILQYERYGIFILIGLILTNKYTGFFSLLENVVNFIHTTMSIPIRLVFPLFGLI